jgi:hypothetical protein
MGEKTRELEAALRKKLRMARERVKMFEEKRVGEGRQNDLESDW